MRTWAFNIAQLTVSLKMRVYLFFASIYLHIFIYCVASIYLQIFIYCVYLPAPFYFDYV